MPSHFHLSYFDPPPGLRRDILAGFRFYSDQTRIEDRHPGALPQLFFNMKGSGTAQFGDRIDHVAQGAYLFSGFSAAAPIRVGGHRDLIENTTRWLGTSLNPEPDAFADQSHMIREIRKFCGSTPSRLGGPKDPLFQTLLRKKNFNRLL